MKGPAAMKGRLIFVPDGRSNEEGLEVGTLEIPMSILNGAATSVDRPVSPWRPRITTFSARYPGICACGEDFSAGDQINMLDGRPSCQSCVDDYNAEVRPANRSGGVRFE